MPEYTADELERSVLDPLFYRYEKVIRSCVRYERELATVKQERDRLAATVAQRDLGMAELLNSDKRLRAEKREIEPKLKALYDNAKEILIEITGGKQRKGMSVAAQRLQKSIDDLYTEVEIPF